MTTISGGGRLYCNGKLLINDWIMEDKSFEVRYRSSNKNVEVQLTAGEEYDTRVEYYKRGNRAAVRLEWEIPSS